MNACSPTKSRVTCPSAEDKVSVKALARVLSYDVVTHTPFSISCEVRVKAVKRLYAVGDVLRGS